MKFEPEKFFIGLIDFFSILMPGAILTYMIILEPWVNRMIVSEKIIELTGNGAWVVFLFASYLLGHFIFLLGSSLLDDYVYEKLRNSTYINTIKDLAIGKPLKGKFRRWLSNRLFKKYVDLALNKAIIIKRFYLKSFNADKSINTFQWSKARLSMEQPSALATVQRFEADSKFFRSLFVVLFLVITWNLIMQRWWVLYAIILLLLALWRFIDQRAKSTRQAYWSIITLEAAKKDGFKQFPFCRLDGITHAGGLVVRPGKKENVSKEFLMIRPENKEEKWVFQKGKVELGEELEETAVREVREEEGVWAKIDHQYPHYDIDYKVDGEAVRVRFYLMELLELRKNEAIERDWSTYKAVLEKATFKETREVIENFGKLLDKK